MDWPGRQWSSGVLLLLVMVWGGACTGTRKPIQRPSHVFDKTDLDLEYGRPEAASRYHQPRSAHRYLYDATDVDLVRRRIFSPPEERPGTSPSAPLSPAPAAPSGSDP